MESPTPNPPRPETPTPRETEAKKGLNIFKLSLANPEWENDPELNIKIRAIKTGIAGINALGIVTAQYDDNQEFAGDEPNKQRFEALDKVLKEAALVNTLTNVVMGFSRRIPLERLSYYQELNDITESRLEREGGINRLIYPPETQFVDVVLSSPDEMDTFQKRWNILGHELRSPLITASSLALNIEESAKVEAAARMGVQSAELSEITEADIDKNKLVHLRRRFKDAKEVISEDGVEILANINPQEDRNAFEFQEQLKAKIKNDKLAQAIQEPVFIVNDEGKIWLEGLQKKIAGQSNSEQLSAEISSIISAFDNGQQQTQDQAFKLRSSISSELMENIQFIWSTGKMRRIAANARQNVFKAFGIDDTNKDTIDYSWMKITPTLEIIHGNKVQLGVEDNGVGLPPGFPGIEEGKSDWGGKAPGSGIGLHGQMMNLRTYYNGDLELGDNPIGQGAVLRATLPLAA